MLRLEDWLCPHMLGLMCLVAVGRSIFNPFSGWHHVLRWWSSPTKNGPQSFALDILMN